MSANFRSLLILALSLALLGIAAAACGSETPAATPTPMPTTATQPSATSTPVLPAATPTPTQQPGPGQTPVQPTATPVPPTPVPTLAPPPAGATEVTLPASKDNTLYLSNDGAFSNGAGAHIFAGNTNDGGTRRAVVAFDVGEIPPGSTIHSATLSLTMSKTTSGGQMIAVHRLLADWGEGASDAPNEEGGGAQSQSGDATWIHRRFDTETWNNPGGDFAPGASASASAAGQGRVAWGPTPQLVADVQAWVDNPSSNFGWILVGNEAASRTTKRFNSRENSNQASRPTLAVIFTPPAVAAPTPTATPVPSTPTPAQAPPTPTPTALPSEEVASLSPVKDNTIYQENSRLSNAVGSHFFAGSNNDGAARRALIAFDVAGQIPAGSTITRVELSLNMSRSESGPQNVAAHRLLADWGEGNSDAEGQEGGGADVTPGDATWMHARWESQPWQTPGGDFVPDASAVTSVGGIARYSWTSNERLIADVQGWLDNPAANFGWILVGNEATGQTSKRFDSSENGSEANRPVLRINYVPPESAVTPTPTPTPTATPAPQTATLNPIRDATLIESATGALANGAGENFFVGRTNQPVGSSIRRGLIAFDFAGKIPQGAAITNVELILTMSKTSSATPQTINLHRALAFWGEGSSFSTGGGGKGAAPFVGEATWIHTRSSSVTWQTPGGDFAPQASASASVAGNGKYTWSSPQLVADVQSWVNGAADNFGWILIGNESTRSAKRFDSRENISSGNWPVLIVTFVE
ncbi:MAG: DNRLRE domain-containing protein [Chloroflexi bacterium]|nr:DNRLRE domain-containing protein [Chloroflexota bacterium]